MRNEQDPEDLPSGDDEPTDPGIPVPSTAVPLTTRRSWLRGRYQIVAAVGLAAVVGIGLAVTQYHGREHSELGMGSRADLPMTPEVAAPPASPTLPTSAPGTPSVAALASSSPTRRQVMRPPAPSRSPLGDLAVTITNSGSIPRDHHTMRVVSARGDLSGQRELAWAADSGHTIGKVRCTQNIQLSPQSSAGVRPTLLLCWRTSTTRSVYVIMVDIDHRPSEQTAAATVNRVRSTLG